ncbi:MAG: pyridinium-3,5-biscarboxylic acid mononucleotide sulfurtransferase [Streptosporangiaceae bacterium]|nr:pyridinium-3,5-biscarboxylic acid mononucleotide sulfurtransferase [Streptosporangiaceae bacterium]
MTESEEVSESEEVTEFERVAEFEIPDLVERLKDRVGREDRLVTAFSGGADSALLATVAHQVLGPRALAVTAVSASLPAAERAAARDFARSHGLAHVEVCTDEMDRPEYRRNDGNRCFHCKSALFDAVTPVAAAMGARVALGTNLDDLSDHRPGQRAARDRDAVFPLVDAGLSKAAVRAVSRELGLATAGKPAAACLSSRIAYGDPVSPELLGQIEQAEDALHRAGFLACRVRAHAAGSVARIEVPPEDLGRLLARREEITGLVRAAGFVFATADLAGLHSGSMNALLPLSVVNRAD